MPIQAVANLSKIGHGACPHCGSITELFAIRLDGDTPKPQRRKFCIRCMSAGITLQAEMVAKRPDTHQAIRRRRKMVQDGEKKTASEIGGRRTPASGALSQKGDAINSHWMVEEKMTQSLSFRLDSNTLNKAANQAASQRRDWVIRVRMPHIGYDVAVLPWNSALPLVRGDDAE